MNHALAMCRARWLLIVVYLHAAGALPCPAQDFDPFAGADGPTEPSVRSRPWANSGQIGEDRSRRGQGPGPVIDQVQFDDEDIEMPFQLISDVSGWSIFPSAKVRGKVSLYAKNITAGELLDQVVTMAGFVYVRQGNVISVMNYEEYMQYYGVEKRVIRLSQREADDVSRVLAQFISPRGKLMSDPSTQSIVVYDVPANLSLLETVIREIDLPTSRMAVEVIKLVYADVSVLHEELKVIYESESADQGSSQAVAVTSQPAAASSTLLAPSGRTVVLCPIVRTNHMVLKGYAQDIAQVKGLLNTLDVAPEFMRTVSYPVINLAVPDLVANLRTALGLVEDSGGSSGAYGSARSSNQTGRTESATSNSRIRVGMLGDTNSIVVTAPDVVHRQVEDFLAICDVPPLAVAGGIEVYKLENADAREVAEVLQELIDQDEEQDDGGRLGLGAGAGSVAGVGSSKQAVSGTAGRPGSMGGAAGPSGEGTAGSWWVQKPCVVANEATNSVVVQASAREQAGFARLIAELDRRRNQVLLEVVVVDIRGNEDIDVGLEWELFDSPDTDHGHLLFTAFGLSTLDPTTGQRALNVLPGGTAAVLRSEFTPFILRALQNNNNAKIRTAPRLLVNDNSMGMIQSIAEEPFEQVNASDTVATTSFGGYVQAGTQLQVTPHISESNYLKLEYQIMLNSFRGRSTDATLPPARDTDMISSEATVPDGDTLIVGGLTFTSRRDSQDKIPVLGDIPLLGHLFRRTVGVEEDTRLYVFVTPRILRDMQFRDLRDLSVQQRLESDEADVYPENGPLELEIDKG